MDTPRAPYTGERLADETALYWTPPAGVHRGYVDGRYGQQHYRIAQPLAATGRVPLVIFHQSPSSGRVYEGLLAILGKGRLVIAPDTPGFGDSDPPPGPPAIADYAAAMGDFLDAMGLDKVDLFGDHTGAKIAGELAQQRPWQVRRIAFNACPVYSDEEMKVMQGHLAEEKPQARTEDGAHLKHAWASMKSTYSPDVPLAQFDRDFTETLRAGELGWYGHNAAFAYSHAENLPKLEQPILVICPDDGLWPSTQRARDYLRNGRLTEKPEWKMGAVSFHTQGLADTLREFLDAPDGTGPSQAAPKPAPAKPAVARRAVRRRFVETSKGAVHVRMAEGGKPGSVPLFIFHMSPRSTHYLEGLIVALGHNRTVIAVDTPGFGESFKPVERPQIGDFAEAMAATITAMGYAQVDVLGDHTGTKTAVELVNRYPQRVRRIVMNTAAVYSPEEKKDWQNRMGPIEVEDDGGHIAAVWERYHRLNRGRMPADQIKLRFYETMRAGPCAWWGPKAAQDFHMDAVLPTVKHPVFLFTSTEDSLLEPTRRAAKLMPHCRYRELEGVGSSPLETHATTVAPLIDAFLDEKMDARP